MFLRQLLEHLTFQPPNHNSLLENEMQLPLIGASVVLKAPAPGTALGVAVAVAELFEGAKNIWPDYRGQVVEVFGAG
jgi:hypothetical protein